MFVREVRDGAFDCIILGSGIGGSMLAAILARQGLSVLMIDSEAHPRFAIGESTTPDTNLRLKLLALKFDVPELAYLSSFETLRDQVSPACGVKRAFSFLYHRDGEEPLPLNTHQYPTLAPPIGADCHFFRQDTDSYLMAVALRHGARIRQQTRVSEIELGPSEVVVSTSKGERFTASFLVDATGMRSVLAEKLNLRHSTPPYETDSRAIFTHLLGVKPYDQVGAPRAAHGLHYPLAQSTLHHIFDGGWFWVIPFDNHCDATNPLASVGLVLDRKIYPETGLDAETEFFDFVRRFPAVARQFEGAQAVRSWVSTGRLQYGARSIVGPRHCLLAHAGFFLDPLYSSGLALTVATVDLLANALIEAVRADDFRIERFAPIDQLFERNMPYLDSMVAATYTSFRDPELWDAWFRVWVVALLIGTELGANAYLTYVQTGDSAVLERTRKEPYTVLLGGAFPAFRELYERALAILEEVREGAPARPAADRIRALFKDAPYVPTYFRWHERTVRTTPAFTVWGMSRMYFWYVLRAPAPIRAALFGWRATTAYRILWRTLLVSRRKAEGRKRRYVRDLVRAWNFDWRTKKGASS